MKKRDRVRVISRKHKGKTGVLIGAGMFIMPDTTMEPGVDMKSDATDRMWQVEFDDGEIESVLESELEIIPPE